VAAPEWSSGQR